MKPPGRCAADFTQAQVHFAVDILKNTEAGNLVGKVVCVGVSVFIADAEQDQQSGANITDNIGTDEYLGPAHSLHHGAHNVLLPPVKSYEASS